MSGSRKLDMETWKRKAHFNFFKNFEEPFFGVTINLDCSIAYRICKQNNYSFFLYYLHKSLLAANTITPFRYRIIGDDLVVFDTIDAAATIFRPDETFGFSHIRFTQDYLSFEKIGKQEIKRVKNTSGILTAASADNVIHSSALPWINFTSFAHARSFTPPNSCPKMAFGKMVSRNGRQEMPLSVHVHHALVDGFHLGQYLDEFQRLMNEETPL